MPTPVVPVVCSVVSPDVPAGADSSEEVEDKIASFQNGQPMPSVVKGRLLNRGGGESNRAPLGVAGAAPRAVGRNYGCP